MCHNKRYLKEVNKIGKIKEPDWKISERKDKKRKIVLSIIIPILTIFVIFLYFYFMVKQTNCVIHYNDDRGSELTCNATHIVYYGPDINYKSEYYSGRKYTNGIICIFALYSRWDEYKNNRYQLHIVGNVIGIYGVKSKDYIEGKSYYNDEIDKYFYINSYEYEY